MSTTITETSATVLIETTDTSTVEVITAGPQGAAAPPYALGELPDLDTTAAVDKSVLYYDAASATWRGDQIHTVITLTDGGAF
jgi:hypothetical protein